MYIGPGRIYAILQGGCSALNKFMSSHQVEMNMSYELLCQVLLFAVVKIASLPGCVFHTLCYGELGRKIELQLNRDLSSSLEELANSSLMKFSNSVPSYTRKKKRSNSVIPTESHQDNQRLEHMPHVKRQKRLGSSSIKNRRLSGSKQQPTPAK